jgi:hypothetical protein
MRAFIVFLIAIVFAGSANAQSIFKALPPYKPPTNKFNRAIIGPTDSLPSLSVGTWNGFRFSGPDVMAAIPDFSLYTGVGIDYVLAKANTTTGKWSYTFTAGPRVYGGANLGTPGTVQAVAGVGVRLTFFNGLLAVGMIYNLTTKKAQGTIGNPAAIIPGLN